jgi:hypothetical protein
VLNATGTSGSSMHHLSFGACQAGRLVAITGSNGQWSGRGAAASVASPGAVSAELGGSGNVPNVQDDCSTQATAADSGQAVGSLTSAEVQVASGQVGGQPWSLWSEKGVTGVDGIENGGLVLGGRWYGLCPGPPNPAEFELVDAGSHGVVYGYVANPGNYAVKLTPGTLSAPVVRQVQGGTFFIGLLPRSACAYPSPVLDATTSSVTDEHHLGFGACRAGQLVTIQESDGSW